MNKDHLENLEAEILNGLAEIESLEARKTPALVGPGTLFGGILTLNFDGANDTIEVSQNADTLSVAYDDGTHHDTLTFATGGVLHKLVINSGAGNDSVHIEDSIDLNYNGNHDDDQIVINAGAGNDVVRVDGNYTHVTIDAGAGNDSVYVGSEHTDSLYGGYGVSIV